MAGKDQTKGRGFKGFYVVIALVAVVGLGALIISSGGGGGATAPTDLTGLDDETLVALAQGVVSGNEDAPVTIMEFGDYQCPACAMFALQTKPQTDLAYVETGQAKLVFHDFPGGGHPHAFLAARAARCAGDQQRYWDYHDALFRAQGDWSRTGDARRIFLNLADALALDATAFRGCLDSDQHAEVVSANLALGLRLGVNQTPTLFVPDGSGPAKRLGGFQFADVQQAMEPTSSNP